MEKRARSNPFRAAAVLAAIALLTLYHLIRHAIGLIGTRSPAQRQALSNHHLHRWSAALCKLMGIRIRSQGPFPPAGSLITPNHLGYMDIPAMASLAPLVFVGKAEVFDWPAVGFLAKRAQQLAVSRRRSRDLLESIARAAVRLKSGQSVCVFLEGTSSGGAKAGRFLSPFLQAAIDSRAPIIPAAIIWQSSLPGNDLSEDLAYWKDHTFAAHVWRLLGLKGWSATIRFGGPLKAAGEGRKEIARQLRNLVAKGQERSRQNAMSR